jgi:hypothetical protein
MRLGEQEMGAKLIFELIVATLVFAGLHLLAEHSAVLLQALPDGIFALLMTLGAILLYAIRKYLRCGFGLIEIMIGIDALWNVPATAPVVVDATTRTQFVMQSAIGLYLIVRGLDNLDQSGVFARLRKARA